MAYILDKVNVLKEKKVQKCSLLIKEEKVDYISETLHRLNLMRTDLSQFMLTPGHVMLNYSFAKQYSFQHFKQEMTTNYLLKGCTTLLVIQEVANENQLSSAILETRRNLLNSPIDFYIGIQIPLKALSPSLIIQCRRKKIPVIIVEIDNLQELLNKPWGWISESYFSYRIPIIPKWEVKQKFHRRGKRTIELWNEITDDYRIPTVDICPNTSEPLNMDFLSKVGIYPEKGDIRIGGELDYNLYDINDIGYTVEEIPILDYSKHIPKVTVHKGKFVKVESKIYFRPGNGNECIVRKPGFFNTSIFS